MDTSDLIDTFTGRCPLCWHPCIWAHAANGRTYRAEITSDRRHGPKCASLIKDRNQLPPPTYDECTPPWQRTSKSRSIFEKTRTMGAPKYHAGNAGPVLKLSCGHDFPLHANSKRARIRRRCRVCHLKVRVVDQVAAVADPV